MYVISPEGISRLLGMPRKCLHLSPKAVAHANSLAGSCAAAAAPAHKDRFIVWILRLRDARHAACRTRRRQNLIKTALLIIQPTVTEIWMLHMCIYKCGSSLAGNRKITGNNQKICNVRCWELLFFCYKKRFGLRCKF